MKKILFILAAAIPAFALAQKENGGAKIEGTIKNVKDTINWVLVQYMADGKRLMDSSVVENGKYSFILSLTEPTMVSFRTKNSSNPKARLVRRNVASVFLEPGKISIESVDSFSNVTVKGSKANTEYEKIVAAMKPYNEVNQKLAREYSGLMRDNKKEEAKKLEDQMDALSAKRNEEYIAYARNNPTSPIAVFALQQSTYEDIDLAKIEPIFNAFPVAAQNSFTGAALKQRLEITRLTAIGNTALNFTQNDTSGVAVSLTSFRGKYVLVDFWASWCGPCRAENPNVVKTFNAYKGKNFNILSVSLDQPGAKDKWIKAIHDDNLAWTHVSDLQYWDNAVAKEYGIQSIPANLLVDPQGKIIAKNLHGDDLAAKLHAVLDK